MFCIGSVKTGTSSLYKSLNILGYRTVRLFDIDTWDRKGWEQYIKKIKKCNFDAFTDYPVGEDDLYKKIDKAIPDSKFILTIRDERSWAKSYVNFFKGNIWEIKTPKDLKRRVQEYKERNKQVIEYFKDKPSQLLVMNIIDGASWNELCSFLNKPIPNKPFPYKNEGKYKNK